MRRRQRHVAGPALVLVLVLVVGGSSGARSDVDFQASPATAATGEPRHPVEALFDRIDDLEATVEALRRALAEASLESAATRRERDELRQFIQDHHEFGPDFERYRQVRNVAEREARRREAEAAREQRESLKAERSSRRRAAMAVRAAQEAEHRRVQGYRDAGFEPLGLDVLVAEMAFNYQTVDGVSARFDYNGLTGTFLRVYPGVRTGIFPVTSTGIWPGGWPAQRLDFTSMTISGSVMNVAEIVRDIGIAVTFFDENGTQVGGEIIQVNNARPEVPYPFTATIDMALDRPFSSASSHVLYADPSEHQ